jgi:Holliday junction resolvase
MKATDAQVLAAYAKDGSCWKAAERLGMCGQSVHERLVRLGHIRPLRRLRAEETERLLRDYRSHRDAGTLQVLAGELGRTVPYLCRKARDLGLTDPRATKRYAAKWKYMPEGAARGLLDQFKRSSFGLERFCKRTGHESEGFSETMRRYFADEWEHVIESKMPRQTMYRVGRAFEYRVRDQLRALGYYVMRSPASRSPVDLTAIKPGVVLMVQCKRNGALPVVGWNELFDLARSCGAVPVLAGSPKGRGADYWRLIGRKDGSRRAQPFETFTP